MKSRTVDFGKVDPFGNPDKFLEEQLRHRLASRSRFYSDVHPATQKVALYLQDRMRLELGGLHPSVFTVRDPSWHMRNVNSFGELDGVSVLHHDGGYLLKEATDGYLILWATIAPTEIYCLTSDKPLYLEPTRLLAIHNKDFMHKTPYLSPENASTRWFAKSFVYTKDPLYPILEGIANDE